MSQRCKLQPSQLTAVRGFKILNRLQPVLADMTVLFREYFGVLRDELRC